jgi:hypothetical protein
MQKSQGDATFLHVSATNPHINRTPNPGPCQFWHSTPEAVSRFAQAYHRIATLCSYNPKRLKIGTSTIESNMFEQ